MAAADPSRDDTPLGEVAPTGNAAARRSSLRRVVEHRGMKYRVAHRLRRDSYRGACSHAYSPRGDSEIDILPRRADSMAHSVPRRRGALRLSRHWSGRLADLENSDGSR